MPLSPSHPDVGRERDQQVIATGEQLVGGRLPEFLVLTAGVDGVDITRICSVHRWASLPLPMGEGIEPPPCELCEAARVFIDGFARYHDLVQKRQMKLV